MDPEVSDVRVRGLGGTMAAQCQKDGRKEKTEKARIVLLGFLTPFSFFSSSSFFFLKIKLQEKVKYIYI